MKILRIIRPMGVGITKPYEVECENEKKYVAKFPGNPEGDRVLINEYICAELAKLFGLPVPNYKLVKIENIEEYVSQLEGIQMVNGTVFCSEKIEKSVPVPNYLALTYTTNAIDALKTLIFDVIIGNNDRNPGNMLLNLKNRTFVMFDHSHVFIYGAVWDKNNVNDLIGKEISINSLNNKTFNTLISSNNISSNKKIIREYIDVIKNIKDQDVDEILNGIPNDWFITIEEKDAIKSFILDRINRVEEIYRLLNIGGG